VLQDDEKGDLVGITRQVPMDVVLHQPEIR
jgi:hypothetical protein